jgi:hypothetical protein
MFLWENDSELYAMNDPPYEEITIFMCLCIEKDYIKIHIVIT